MCMCDYSNTNTYSSDSVCDILNASHDKYCIKLCLLYCGGGLNKTVDQTIYVPF